MQRALELNPLSLQHNTVFAGFLYYQRKYDEAIQHFQETVALDPNFPVTHLDLAIVYLAKGMYEQAIAECRKAGPYALQMLALIHARAGRPDEARKILQELIERYREAYYSPTWIGWIYLGLGDKDRAFEWFEKAYEDRDALLTFMLKVEPAFDPLRSDPRYAALLRKMNLEP